MNCKCAVPAIEISQVSLCMEGSSLVVWLRCKRCDHAEWFVLTPDGTE